MNVKKIMNANEDMCNDIYMKNERRKLSVDIC